MNVQMNKPVKTQPALPQPSANIWNAPNEFSVHFRNMHPGFTIYQVIHWHCLVTCISEIKEHCNVTFANNCNVFIQPKPLPHPCSPSPFHPSTKLHPQARNQISNEQSTPMQQSQMPAQSPPRSTHRPPSSTTWALIASSKIHDLSFFINWFQTHSHGINQSHCRPMQSQEYLIAFHTKEALDQALLISDELLQLDPNISISQ
jgi:hypothetical protein